MRPTNLLDIRYDLGHRYLAAVNSWKDEPHAKQEQEVKNALQCYAQELVKWAARERTSAPTTLRVEYIRELSSSEGMWAKALRRVSPMVKPVKEVGPNAISVGGSVGSFLLIPLLGPAAVLLNFGIKLGLVIYQLFPPHSKPEDIELATDEVPAAKTIVELDLPPKTHDDSTAPEGPE
jgi:hypothetical protein